MYQCILKRCTMSNAGGREIFPTRLDRLQRSTQPPVKWVWLRLLWGTAAGAWH
jgi:hypothetical protein